MLAEGPYAQRRYYKRSHNGSLSSTIQSNELKSQVDRTLRLSPVPAQLTPTSQWVSIINGGWFAIRGKRDPRSILK